MFIPASSEFVALCKAQVAVLTQSLGATLTAVYLTEDLVKGGEAKLIPVVVYPEAREVWEEEDCDLMLPEVRGKIDTIPQLARTIPRLLPQASESGPDTGSTSGWGGNFHPRQRQIVLPLIHESAVLGLLVTSREDRSWNENEKVTIERIARTITLAYILDQRRVWFEQQLNQQRHLQAQQRDRLDDLLHQFRNPLTALRTFGKLLVRRLLPGDKNTEVASSIVRESDRLQELLQQFDECLDSEDYELAPLTLAATPVADACPEPTTTSLLPAKAFTLEAIAVASVLEPLLVSAQAIAQERGLKLSSQIASDLPLVQGNATALREVLSNLIDNALKYTPMGGTIDIRVAETRHTSQGEMLAIAISDTGPGIPQQDLEHLFERHYRGVQAATPIPGSGLGLAIAKELITQMHGEINVFSPAQLVWAKQSSDSMSHGKGTTFVVWLPLAEIED